MVQLVTQINVPQIDGYIVGTKIVKESFTEGLGRKGRNIARV